jgi:exportin-T
MDDFEKGILFSFDQSGSVDAGLKGQAQALLQSARQSPDTLQLCLSRAENSSYVEVRFWCLQTLHEAVRTGYETVPPDARAQLKQALLRLGTGAAPPQQMGSNGVSSSQQQQQQQLPAFLRNKAAQTLAAVAAAEFPEVWPAFFQDLLGTLAAGPPAVDFFCRVLAAIDEDIISLDVPRSAEETKRSMQFKDAMREGALADIADAWRHAVDRLRGPAPATAAFILQTVQRYVHWIDIGLVANAAFVPLLFAVLSSPEEGLRGAAADVLTEIVLKRMEPVSKLALIQQLGLVPQCARWHSGLPADPESESELALKFAKLLAALASEVLDAWKRVENNLVSLAAVGLPVAADAAAEATAVCSGAASMVDALFPTVLAVLGGAAGEEAAAAVTPFALAHVARLRTLQKRAGGAAPGADAHVPALLEAVANAARYPNDSTAAESAPASPAEATTAEEEEASMAERRQELFVLFRNAARLAPDAANALVGSRLEAALSRPGASWQDAELALGLLYQLGEGATDDDLRPGTGLALLAAAVVQADPSPRHRLVALALLETYARYWRVLQQQQDLLPKAVNAFLGDPGMGHPAAAVQGRAAYLFCRLCKHLRGQLRPAAPDIMRSLQPHLVKVAASPTEPKPAGPALQRTASNAAVLNAAGPALPPLDDRLYAFEAAGLLLGGEELSTDEQLGWVASCLQPLVAHVESGLASAMSEAAAASGAMGQMSRAGGGGGAGPAPSLLVQQALEALTRFSKGFSLKVCTEHRPEVGVRLAGALRAAVAVPRGLPGSKPLRARFISLLHRMVECLGPRYADFLDFDVCRSFSFCCSSFHVPLL